MTYITAAQLQSAIGTRDYNMTLSLEGGTTADSTTVAAVLARVDAEIDSYHTALSTADKAVIAYPIAAYWAYYRRGPGNVPDKIQKSYEAALKRLERRMGITARIIIDPQDEMEEDTYDELLEDLQ